MKLLTAILLFVAFECHSQVIIDSQKLFDDINKYRRSKNLRKLKHDPSIQAEVDNWAEHIVNDFNHFKCSCWENIAMTNGNVDSILEIWKKSRGHNANLLNRKIKTMAVAIYKDGHGRYWAVWRSVR